MTTSATYQEFRIYYYSDYVFTCFARNIGHAIEQLNEQEGENFEVSSITSAKVSIDCGAWQPVKLPIFEVVK